jgi:phosphoribosylglycinamide formyltransferase 1
MKSIVILISGRGSNMEAIIAAVANGLPIKIRAVISNRPDAVGLTTAKQHGIATHALDHKTFATREAFDAALMQIIDTHAPDIVVLAGFMRVLTASFVNHYTNRLVNIHPSLLPSFPGVHTHQRALQAGVKIHGATVHLVTPELDHGPIIVQAAVPVLPGDTEATLAARVLAQEHRIYPLALRWLAEDKVKVDENGVVQIAGQRVLPGADMPSLTAPSEK